jgi:mono/diheme cytochrome c family protein
MKNTAMTVVMLTALAAPAVAAEQPSAARGKELFESTQLGTNGKSCAGCHPGGKKLEAAAGYDEEQLGEIINQCITRPLKGKALDPAASDMKSLIMYLRTFAKHESK